MRRSNTGGEHSNTLTRSDLGGLEQTGSSWSGRVCRAVVSPSSPPTDRYVPQEGPHDPKEAVSEMMQRGMGAVAATLAAMLFFSYTVSRFFEVSKRARDRARQQAMERAERGGGGLGGGTGRAPPAPSLGGSPPSPPPVNKYGDALSGPGDVPR